METAALARRPERVAIAAFLSEQHKVQNAAQFSSIYSLHFFFEVNEFHLFDLFQFFTYEFLKRNSSLTSNVE